MIKNCLLIYSEPPEKFVWDMSTEALKSFQKLFI